MRKLISSTFVSLDGVMQAPGGPDEDRTGGFTLGGWTAPLFDESMGSWMDRTFATQFDLLLGRRTYEIFAAYWPHHTDSLVGEAFSRAHKYVASHRLHHPAWEHTTVLSGNVPEQVAALKDQDGPDLLLQGSGNLIQSLLTAGLIDEFRVLVFPLLLGPGKRLFAEGTIPAGLRLTEHEVSQSGVVMATYALAGPVATGSFADDEPSQDEPGRRSGPQD
ncbi:MULTISPECIES: dihydrofolate reductase family protein [Micrococcaceae]|uniref:dihydrofolate reductase family protein n=1 Tax=Micrococcaceae TaxID=1268 RepID=UPI001616982F|nr:MULTISPECIES: dihydrofolate reductase family protein [Micrococcaceae]MBB5748686.1 dihydrofolate reductase [Micrococcus sp. TA1]HRO31226.1 dihydrofolate reductase family protein [Citricoccus sp.]HRO94792.1 dihydrofolate reductase family protein [Citricoccus sp.]